MKIIQRSDGKFYATYVTRTKFGDWMAQNLCRTGMTIREVAEKLHIGRVSISKHLNGLHNPTFRDVVAYCWLFGNIDDPNDIYKLVKEES